MMTFGEVLVCFDAVSKEAEEAVQRLALRWLESGVWHDKCAHEALVKKAVKREVYSILREERRRGVVFGTLNERVDADAMAESGPIAAKDELAHVSTLLGDKVFAVLVLDAFGFSSKEAAVHYAEFFQDDADDANDANASTFRKRLQRAREDLAVAA
jgi:DNA-directed RNA polymerase specialized sigma24 family protein